MTKYFEFMDNYNFQYCQKIVVFNNDKVLLCKRKGEADYDGVYSFIGGKMEITDQSILSGLKREKDEEVGFDFKIKIYKEFSNNVLYKKVNGKQMILPHYYAEYVSGDILLNEEYSDYKWVKISELETFEPIVPNVVEKVKLLKKLKSIMSDQDFVEI